MNPTKDFPEPCIYLFIYLFIIHYGYFNYVNNVIM